MKNRALRTGFWIFAYVLLAALMSYSCVQAQEAGETLRISTRLVPPFVIRDNSKLTGFSIELWDTIADRLKVKSTYIEKSNVAEILRSVPALPGVFALRGEDPRAEPYLTRTADMRRRMTRLLNPPEEQSKRLNLRDRVCTIEYTVTGSEFESLLVLYDAASRCFGAVEARRRLKLHTPFFLRLTMGSAHPRVYSTNRLSKRGLDQTYGPFPSRRRDFSR